MAPNRDGVKKRKPAQATGAKLQDRLDSGTSVVSKEDVQARGAGVHSEVDDYLAGHVFSEVRVFFTGLMFLTRLPCPAWCDHHPAYFMRSLAWFPLFGVVVGLWAAAFHGAILSLWSPEVAAVLSTLMSVWLTGCFHEDGLTDTFDGFGGGWSRREILAIMKDSRVGTYGAMGLMIFTALKFRLLTELGSVQVDSPPSGVAGGDGEDILPWLLAWLKGGLAGWAGGGLGAGPALVVAHAVGRATSAPLVYLFEYVQDDEDAKGSTYNWLAQSQRLLGLPRTLISSITAVGIAFLFLEPDKAFLCVGVLIVMVCLAGTYAQSTIGGVMGDFLGCTIAVTECMVYMTLLADTERMSQAAAAAGWAEAMRPLLWCAGVSAVPILYSRRIANC